MAKKIKQWQANACAESVKEGRSTLEQITDERLRRRVERTLREDREAARAEGMKVDTIRLTGRVVRETDKAVLFRQHDPDNTDGAQVPESWWPKSQIEVGLRELGPLDRIYAPRWLVESKVEQQED